MSLSNPDAPPAARPAPWPARPILAGPRPGSRALAFGLASGLAMILLAAWAVPPALD